MSTIEIHAACEDSHGRSQTITRTIDINSQDGHLSLEDHQKILPILLALITEAKALCQDPDYPAEPRTTLVNLNWHLRLIDPDGTPQTITEDTYFQQAAQFPELTPLLLDYCHHTDHGAYDTRLWSNDELPAGTYAILPLVYQDRAAIAHYIEFLRTNDLDHEVDQSDDIDDIIEQYGWCPETARLAIARAISCCGQHGHEHFTEFLDQGLAEYLADPSARTAFLEDIHTEIRAWVGPDYDQILSDDDARQQFLEQLRFWTEPFEEVLTDDEMEGIRQVS